MFVREAMSRKWHFLWLIQEFVLDSQIPYCEVVPVGQQLEFRFKMKLHFMANLWSSGGSKVVTWPPLWVVCEFRWNS